MLVEYAHGGVEAEDPVTEHHLAQASIARLRAPVGSPLVREFVAAVDRINALAEASPGFLWRHQTQGGHGAAANDDLLIVNVSVWTDYAALHAFAYRSRHGHFVRRRSEWFQPVSQPSTVLWWVPAGTRPSVAQAHARLEYVARHGPTPSAFTLRCQFDARGRRIRRVTADAGRAAGPPG
jgi:hypothetical protein